MGLQLLILFHTEEALECQAQFSKHLKCINKLGMDCGATGSSVHGISQAKLLEWLPFPSPRDLPDPGIKPSTPSLQAKSLPTESSERPISKSQRSEHNKTKTDTFATIQ